MEIYNRALQGIKSDLGNKQYSKYHCLSSNINICDRCSFYKMAFNLYLPVLENDYHNTHANTYALFLVQEHLKKYIKLQQCISLGCKSWLYGISKVSNIECSF